jgi:hypothetical protein
MDLEEQVKLHREISQQINELEDRKKALGISILHEMKGKVLKTADYVVRRYKRLSIKLSIERARELDAVKLEEIVDKEKIKTLHQEGKTIEGVSEYEYIVVTAPKSPIERSEWDELTNHLS